jgi:hypothetical protein
MSFAGFIEWITYKETVNSKNMEVTQITFLKFPFMGVHSQ